MQVNELLAKFIQIALKVTPWYLSGNIKTYERPLSLINFERM